MKQLKLNAEYIIKSDLVTMLEKMIEEIKEDDNLFLFEVESNIGGNIVAEFKNEELPDLRQRVNSEIFTQVKKY